MTLRTYAIDRNKYCIATDPDMIIFVEADPVVIEPLLLAYQKAWFEPSFPDSPRVIFTADQVSWRAEEPMPIRHFISRLDTPEDVADVAAAEEFRRLALSVETLHPAARKWLQDLNFRLRTP